MARWPATRAARCPATGPVALIAPPQRTRSGGPAPPTNCRAASGNQPPELPAVGIGRHRLDIGEVGRQSGDGPAMLAMCRSRCTAAYFSSPSVVRSGEVLNRCRGLCDARRPRIAVQVHEAGPSAHQAPDSRLRLAASSRLATPCDGVVCCRRTSSTAGRTHLGEPRIAIARWIERNCHRCRQTRCRKLAPMTTN
jgi:hypothetical protein